VQERRDHHRSEEEASREAHAVERERRLGVGHPSVAPAQLRAGGAFHCHKGVPLDPEGEDGFDYPKDRPEKLRLCRGYLNALGKWWGAAEPDQSKAPGAPEKAS